MREEDSDVLDDFTNLSYLQFISPQMILDTVRKPDVILSQWKGERFAFFTEKVTVIMNKLGKIVTVWGQEDYTPNVY